MIRIKAGQTSLFLSRNSLHKFLVVLIEEMIFHIRIRHHRKNLKLAVVQFLPLPPHRLEKALVDISLNKWMSLYYHLGDIVLLKDVFQLVFNLIGKIYASLYLSSTVAARTSFCCLFVGFGTDTLTSYLHQAELT